MMKARDLVFHDIQGNAPAFVCNNCGNEFASGGMAASIRINSDSEFTIVVCSAFCAHSYKIHPYADKHITETIDKILRGK